MKKIPGKFNRAILHKNDMEELRSIEKRLLPAKMLIFAGSDYYPMGGMRDFMVSASSLTEAILISNEAFGKYHEKTGEVINWIQIVDHATLEIVEFFPKD